MASPLRVQVSELLGRPGATRQFTTSVVLPLEVSTAKVVGDVVVDLRLEAVLGGLTVSGELGATARSECRRCLAAIEDDLAVQVEETFETEATEGETYPIDRDHIDLEPLVREAVLLALPVIALCGDDCIGPDPERYPARTGDDVEARDPRWAALDVLRDEPED